MQIHIEENNVAIRAWVGSVVRLAITFFKGGGFEPRVAVALFSENSDLSVKFALQV